MTQNILRDFSKVKLILFFSLKIFILWLKNDAKYTKSLLRSYINSFFSIKIFILWLKLTKNSLKISSKAKLIRFLALRYLSYGLK